jgi:hypothetical protein
MPAFRIRAISAGVTPSMSRRISSVSAPSVGGAER